MPATAGRSYFFLGLGEQILAKPATSAAGALHDSLARSPMTSWDAPMSFESRGREFESRRPDSWKRRGYADSASRAPTDPNRRDPVLTHARPESRR